MNCGLLPQCAKSIYSFMYITKKGKSIVIIQIDVWASSCGLYLVRFPRFLFPHDRPFYCIKTLIIEVNTDLGCGQKKAYVITFLATFIKEPEIRRSTFRKQQHHSGQSLTRRCRNSILLCVNNTLYSCIQHVRYSVVILL